MTTPVIVTTYISAIEFDFNMQGEVEAVLSNTRTVVQDPDTMNFIAASTVRSNMDLEEAKQIIANAQPANPIPASDLMKRLNGQANK